MAADAYKGLTIRIGADTTDLRKALKYVNSAAKSTQSELKRVNNALKLDPTNVNLIAGKITSLGNRATTLAAKMVAVDQAVREFGRDDGLRKLANDTDNATLAAQRLLERYTSVDAKIAELRRKEAIAYYAGDDEFDQAGYAKREKMITAYVAKLREGEVEARVFAGELRDLAAEHNRLQSEMDQMRRVEAFKRAQQDAKALRAEVASLTRDFVEAKRAVHEMGSDKGLRKIKADLNLTDEAAEELRKELKMLDEALKLDPDSMDAAVKKMQNLQEQEKEARTRAEQLNKEADLLRKKLQTIDAGKLPKDMQQLSRVTLEAEREMAELKSDVIKLEGALDQATASMHEMEAQAKAGNANAGYDKQVAKVKSLQEQLRVLTARLNEAESAYDAAKTVAELRRVETELARAKAEANGLTEQMKGDTAKMAGMFYGLRSVGTSLMATVSPYAMMAGMRIVQSTETVDAAFRDMRKTVEGTEEQFAQLKQAALDYSTTHITSADTILEIEAMGGQLGIAVENLEAFATTVSNLDIATDMESDDIAADLGKMATVLGMTNDEYSKFADALVRLGNNEPAFESDIMKIATRYMGMAKVVGMSADQILAWATAATATGQKSEAAGSSMQRFISGVETAVNSGGDALDLFAKVAGKSSKEFAKAFNKDASGALYDIIVGLGDMQRNGESVNQMLKKLGINNVRDKQLLEGLAQQMANATDEVNVLGDSLEMASTAWNGQAWVDASGNIVEAGDAAREAERKSEGFSGAIAKMRNNITVLAQSVGESLTPFVNAFSDALKALNDFYGGLSDTTKQVLNVVGLTGVAIGPLLTLVGTLGQGAANLVKFKKEQGGAWNKTTKGANEASTATHGYVIAANDAEKSSKKMSKGMKAAIASASMLKKASYGLAIAGVAFLASKAVDAAQDLMDLNKVVNGSSDAMKSLDGSMSAMWSGDGAGEAIKSTGELRNNIKDLVSSTLSMREGIASSFSDTSTEIAMLNSYAKTIEDLGGKGKLTDEQMAELKLAIDGVNEALGTDYTVKDFVDPKENGKVRELIDSTKELIEVRKYEMQAEVLGDAYKQSYTKKLEWQQKLTEAQKTYNEAVSLYNNNVGNPYAESNLAQAKAALDDITASLQSVEAECESYESRLNLATQAQEKGAKSIAGMVMSNDALTTSLGANASAFVSALTSLGIKAKSLGDNELTQLAGSFNGTTTSIIGALESMGIKFDESAAQVQVSKEAIAQALINLAAEGKEPIIQTAKQVGKLVKKLDDAGFSSEQLASVTPTQWQEILAAYDGNIDSIKTKLQELIDKNAEAGSDSGSWYAKNLLGTAGDAQSAGQAVSDATVSGMGDQAGIGGGLGGDFVTGYANGILAGKDKVSEAAAEVAAAAAAATAKKQDSSSPSKVAASLGGDYTDGYALGIEKGAGKAGEAARKVAMSAISETNRAMSRARYEGIVGLSEQVGSVAGQMATQSLGLNEQIESLGSKLSGGLNVSVTQSSQAEQLRLLKDISDGVREGQTICIDKDKAIGYTAGARDVCDGNLAAASRRGVDL